MEFDKNILEARFCPYCGAETEYIDSSYIYGKSYGMIYICKPCDAYVGVHHGNTKRSLGRLADKDLREAKKKAHFYFDQLWRKAIKRGRKKHEARNSAYKWLSEKLNTPIEFTHIGMFDAQLCNKVIEVCKPYCINKTYKPN